MLLTISKINFGQQDILLTHYNQFDIEEEKTSFRDYTSQENEVNQMASFFFLFYKEFVSSQDVNSCVFHPSCSVYTIESIRKLGLLEGLANSFDRLCRCNPFSQKYYTLDSKTHKLYDPVQEK